MPEVLKFAEEPEHIRKAYGLDQENTKAFGQDLLAARRLVERGVRFVQVFHGYRTDGNGWDAHSELKKNHTKLCGETDLPLAGLIQGMIGAGLPEPVAKAFASFDDNTVKGGLSGVTGDYAKLTGQQPQSFESWLEKAAPALAA